MTCYFPLSAYQNINTRQVVICKDFGDYQESPSKRFLQLPCGQCIGCRIRRSKDWAIRCVHEASLHEDNCFITLTYNSENLPSNGSLDVRHFQLFMKRLRKKFGAGIRFFQCGEYGERLLRPHYHAIIFGFDFLDKRLFKSSKSGNSYVSSTLESLWGKGFCVTGGVSFQSAAYVSRYILKKVRKEPDAFGRDPHYGSKKPEYVTMSRRPGIASEWFRLFHADVFPGDFVVLDSRKVRTPRYYDKLLADLDPDLLESVKQSRIDFVESCAENNTSARLAARHAVAEASLSELKRPIEC